MDLPNPKDLKRLAKACREAGIRTFKGNGIEFTLDDLPVKEPKRLAAPTTQDRLETYSPSDEALLLWSTPNFSSSDDADPV